MFVMRSLKLALRGNNKISLMMPSIKNAWSTRFVTGPAFRTSQMGRYPALDSQKIGIARRSMLNTTKSVSLRTNDTKIENRSDELTFVEMLLLPVYIAGGIIYVIYVFCGVVFTIALPIYCFTELADRYKRYQRNKK